MNQVKSTVRLKNIDERKKKAAQIVAGLKKLYPEAKTALRHANPWELYIAVVLSAQTTDKKVNEVTGRLFKKYKTLGDYVNADPEVFEQEIKLRISDQKYHRFGGKCTSVSVQMYQRFGGSVPPVFLIWSRGLFP